MELCKDFPEDVLQWNLPGSDDEWAIKFNGNIGDNRIMGISNEETSIED